MFRLHDEFQPRAEILDILASEPKVKLRAKRLRKIKNAPKTHVQARFLARAEIPFRSDMGFFQTFQPVCFSNRARIFSPG